MPASILPPVSGAENNIIQFSSNTINYLNTLPALIPAWQAEDIRTGNTDGYFQNPLANTILNIESLATSIETKTTVISSLMTIADASTNTANSANNFWYHTNRISGVVSAAQDGLLALPHYDTAVALGKLMIYLTNKNGEITDNSPIVGNFTSLFTANNLNVANSTITSDYALVTNSIYQSGVNPSTGDPIYQSNLNSTQISTITANLISISTFMDSYRSNDEIFFATETNILNQYKKVRNFNNIGQTEVHLLGNYIGTDKLKSRLNL